MLYNEIELMEMARDYEAMEAQAIQDAEELRQLREGERIIVPQDLEHAKAMFRLSVMYLSNNDPTFELKLVDLERMAE